MKKYIYPKLAWNGIWSNKRLYVPYLLTGAVMVMMHYIISFLGASELLNHMKGGGTLRMLLPLGAGVIAVFSMMFLFYSNSLLLRQRNREFGLYNILGMDKGNLGRIMLWENLMVAAGTIISGLCLGILLSKLAELGMVNLLGEQVNYTLSVDFKTAGTTLILFLIIYFILLLNALLKVRHSNPLELLRSSSVGEKPPKANWLFAIVGVVLLGTAYYIAVSIEQPLTAISWFFTAVLLVIIATYLLFIAGSVVLCRILQKNKGYYYKPAHFVSVSSMAYRMKRNGAGLASICILVTMVLVMLSATISLYVGAEDSLNFRYPKEIALRLAVPSVEQFNEENFAKMRQSVTEKVESQKNIVEYSSGELQGLFTEEGMIVDAESYPEFNAAMYDQLGVLNIITLETYNRIMGTDAHLESGECFLYCLRTEYLGDTFSIQYGPTLHVKEILDEMEVSGYAAMQILPCIVMVTVDFEEIATDLHSRKNSHDVSFMELFWNYGFDMDGAAEEEIAAYDKLRAEVRDIVPVDISGRYSYSIDGKEANRTEFYGMYGGMFFIGILLSIVLLFAAVVIIYYKQISEGFEDQKRFEVMQKVGMMQQDIKKTIDSQVLTVFFLPLLLAGLHLSFAFPIIWRLLQMFNFFNLSLMMLVTVFCFLIFAAVYALVYKLTSNTYYHIVSGTGRLEV